MSGIAILAFLKVGLSLIEMNKDVIVSQSLPAEGKQLLTLFYIFALDKIFCCKQDYTL